MKYFKKLVGERIYLSPMNLEDIEIYTKWMNDFCITDGLHSSSKICNLPSEKDWLENSLKSGEYQFSIVDLKTDELIGNCGIMNIDNIDRIATVGVFIGEKDNRNKGYGKEALRLLLDYGFNYLNIHNIGLKVFSFNDGAIKCYKDVGFKEYGRRREAYFVNGKYYDSICMDILAKEFNESFIKNKNI